MVTATAGGLRRAVSRRPVAVFVALVLVTSWPMLGLGGDQLGPLTSTSLLWLLCPSACAFVVTWLADGRIGVRELAERLLRWRVPVRWYLVALFGMGAAYWSAAYVVTALVRPGQLPALPLPPVELALTVLGNLAVVFVIAGLGEEFGWRGFLLPRLSRHLGPVRAASAVGLVWWAWHIPVRLVGVDEATAALFLVAVLADSIILAWLFHRTGGSVLLVALMHAANNTWSSILFLTFTADPVLIDGVRVGLYVVVALVLIARPGRQGP